MKKPARKHPSAIVRIAGVGVLTLAAAAAAWPPAAWSQPTPSGAANVDASRLARVTVYPGSATVERTLRLAAGARQATFACLPAGLDAQSLQVASDAGIRVGDIAVRQQARELLGKACVSPLEDRIKGIEDQIATLQAEQAGIGYALGYLNSFSGAEKDSAGRGGASTPAQISATVEALRQNAKAPLTRAHQIQREREVLEMELKPLKAERDRAGGARGHVSVVHINLAAPQGGELRLSYQVRGPSWQPSYRATLDSAARKVRLERQAQVAQNTGEDWTDAQITLSTGQPGAATQGPLPSPWRVDMMSPNNVPVLAEAAPMMAPAPAALERSKVAAAGADAPAEPDMPNFDVSVFEGSFATQFVVPQRISVPSNGQRVTLSLGEQVLGAKLLTRTTPASDASVFLVADMAAPPGVWPVGSISLYRDGAYVGHGRLDTTLLPRQGLSFGRDERVTVRTEQPARTDGTGGFIGSRRERRVGHIFVVENRHKEAITLQVLDAAPVPQNDEVKVQSSYQPKPETEKWNDQPGTVLWQQALAAGATQRLTADHVITWPKDASLIDNR
ncbi:DUF4139 domain-containing protein [Ottowia sp.]|uniref:DUF4139 domain-containing protein n=1 Tax=Ottowia sp. TaxID=1898956 RepID=UPI003A8665FB